MSRRGIRLIDLIGVAPAQTQALLPDDVTQLLDEFAVVNHRSITTDVAFIHFGAVRADLRALPPLDGSRLEVEANEVERGVPFRLLFRRQAPGALDTVEPLATAWQLDLLLDPVSVKLPWFEPARFAPAEGALPARIESLPAPQADGAEPRSVRLNVSGVYRIESDGTGVVTRRFVDPPDPFDPDAPTGAIVNAAFEPPHFFLGSLGMSADRVTFDFSDRFTPPAAVARGHGPEWRGIVLDRARVFLPWSLPVLGRVSLGVRDLLLGSPFGLQGDLEVELGRRPGASQDPLAGTVRFFRTADGDDEQPLPPPTPAAPGSERLFHVSLGDGVEGPVLVRGHLPTIPENTRAEWTLPGGEDEPSEFAGTTTPRFRVSTGSRVELTTSRREGNGPGGGVEDRAVSLGTVVFEFTSTSEGPSFPPRIALFRNGTKLADNVVYLGGAPAVIEGLELRADPEVEGLRWTSGIGTFVETGPAFAIRGLHRKVEPGVHFMTLRDAADRTRQVVVELLAAGELVVGARAGVLAGSGPLQVSRLRNEWDLFSFHQVGGLRRTEGGTRIVEGEAEVPPGVIAEVGLRPGDPGGNAGGETGTEPSPPESGEEVLEHLQILMEYDSPNPVAWGHRGLAVGGASQDGPKVALMLRGLRPPDPDSGFEGSFEARPVPDDLESALGRWAAGILQGDPSARIHVIGRVDDIGGLDYNRTLAERRAKRGAELIREGLGLVGAGGTGANITHRGELTGVSPGDPRFAFEDDLRPRHAEVHALERVLGLPSAAFEPHLGTPHRLVKEAWKDVLAAGLWDPANHTRADVGLRPLYRRVDVFALHEAGASSGGGAEPTNAGALAADPLPGARRALVPGEDLPKSTEPLSADPSYPHLMRGTVTWDSPEIESRSDYWPTKAELLYRWVNEGILLPDPDAPEDPDRKEERNLLSCAEPQGGPSASPQVLTIFFRLSYDARTREVVIAGGIESEGGTRGLFCLDDSPLAPVMTLAPALLPRLEEADLHSGAQLAALIGAGAAALALGLTENGRFVVEGLRFEARRRRPGLLSEPERVRVGLDYRARTDWNLGIARTTRPLELSVRNAGLLLETKPAEGEGAVDVDRDLRFVFEDAAAQIVDSGQFEVTGPLGRLLRVIAARVGSGSTWVEVELGLALDLGIVHVSRATLRGTVRDGTVDVELRGLEVEVDVPGLLRGRGRLSVEANGTGGGGLRSAINLAIIPAGISCGASLALRGGMFSLQVSTEFSTPIPLGSSGVGIFGLQGAFVSNGTRDFTGIATDDVVRRELEWFVRSPEDRYAPRPGQWALGLGTVVGTLPDRGFTFNAKGLLALEVPELQLRLGIDGRFLSRPDSASEQGDSIEGSAGELRLLGIVAIDPDHVVVGALGRYERRKLIELEVPLAGLFPRRGPDPFFLRVGADGFEGRLQPPVRARILPGVLDKLEGFAFLMIEERGLPKLGGRAQLSFPGFAVGIGVGFELKWGNRFVGLEVDALLLAGIGTNPLTLGAVVSIDGEVRFVLLSAGIRAELLLFHLRREGADLLRIEGKVCARVGVWRFKKTKCGEIGIGDEELPLDRAPSPIRGVDLVSRLDRVIGPAAREDGAEGGGTTAWPDLVPVIHFDHPVRVELSGSAFDPGHPGGPTWTGQGSLRYAYRVTGIELRPRGGPPLAGPLPSTWVFPAHRPQFPSPGDPPAGDEAHELHLLSDHPAPWGRNLFDGGRGLLGDPAGNLKRVCEPAPDAGRVCARGQSAVRLAPGRVRVRPEAPSPPPYPSFFEGHLAERFGNLGFGAAALLLAEAGLELVPGSRRPLAGIPTGIPDLAGVTEAYDFAHVADEGRFAVSLPVELRFLPEVVEPSLVLSLCPFGPAVDRVGVRCDRFDAVAEGSEFAFLRHRDFTYGATGSDRFRAVRVGRTMTLRCPPRGLRIGLPERSGEVVVKIVVLVSDDVFAAPRLTAFDGSGGQIATATNPDLGIGSPGELRVADARNRIASVQLGGSGAEHLIQVCYRTVVDPRVDGLLAEAGRGPVPEVVGTTRTGERLPWPGTVLPQAPTIGPPACTFVRYTPREAEVFTSVRIGPWNRSRIGLAVACAVTADAARQRDDDQAARDRFVAEWNESAGASADEHPGRFLLDADTDYELVVRWDARIFRHPREDGRVSNDSEPEGDPWETPVPMKGVVAFGPSEEVFAFRTAAEESPLPAEPPADTEDESAFDPRAARRYVLRMRPDADSAPHFADDPVEVRYSVDHLAALLGKFGRELVVQAVRTDPPPGSLAGGGGPAPPPPAAALVSALAAVALPTSLLEAVDAGMAAAGGQAGSCLDERTPEGHTAPFLFDLEPRAEYDLLVTAAPAGDPDALEPVLARTHFRTSRYRNARELLDALGFTDPEPDPILPVEALIGASLPVGRRDGDEALEEALGDLGLDPWPLSVDPRLTLLVRSGGGLAVVGVLLEGPEPIERGPRARVAAARILHAGGTVGLDLVRASGSGTRLLFSSPDAVPVEGEAALLELELATSREGTLRGRRFITSTGLSLAEELLP